MGFLVVSVIALSIVLWIGFDVLSDRLKELKSAINDLRFHLDVEVRSLNGAKQPCTVGNDGEMRVRIVKANKPTYWYANHIGAIYAVKQSSRIGGENAYDTHDERGYLAAIDKDDCEVVED